MDVNKGIVIGSSNHCYIFRGTRIPFGTVNPRKPEIRQTNIINRLNKEAMVVIRRDVCGLGLSIITTTWCEKENIGRLLLRIHEVLQGLDYEIIVVDDGSPDGTAEEARKYADKVIVNSNRLGQTLSLARGINEAKGDCIVTIDSDLENPPELIPKLLDMLKTYDFIVASRAVIPRISEKLASIMFKRKLKVRDIYSNFKAFKGEFAGIIAMVKCGETFGAEFTWNAVKHGLDIGELVYKPPPRRRDPRIGGLLKANSKIMAANFRLLMCLLKDNT